MNRRNFLRVGGGAVIASQLSAVEGFASDKKQTSAAESTRELAQKPLKVRFLGTGAADWKGKDERGEQRRLSSVLLDGKILIDFTPTDRDMLPEGCHPGTIFYTHSHGDHYNPEAAIKLGIKKVYAGETWIGRCRRNFADASEKLSLPSPDIAPIALGQQVVLDGVTVTALPGNHCTSDLDEQCLIYLVEKGPVRLLYATDTGGIMGKAARLCGIDSHIKPAKPITALIMEATMGLGHLNDFRIYVHSSVEDVKRIADVLISTKLYLPAPGQPVYLTHMARTLHGTQAELDTTLPEPLKAAYDGLEVEFR